MLLFLSVLCDFWFNLMLYVLKYHHIHNETTNYLLSGVHHVAVLWLWYTVGLREKWLLVFTSLWKQLSRGRTWIHLLTPMDSDPLHESGETKSQTDLPRRQTWMGGGRERERERRMRKSGEHLWGLSIVSRAQYNNGITLSPLQYINTMLFSKVCTDLLLY